MAYVTQEIITKARAALKVLNKEYGVKATLSGKGDSTLGLSISEGSIDFVQSFADTLMNKRTMHDVEGTVDYVKKSGSISINQYYLDTAFDGKALEYLEKAKDIMYADHWDKSDSMTDYFHCAYYISMRVGRWNKPYEFKQK
jgi:hypothetical protein